MKKDWLPDLRGSCTASTLSFSYIAFTTCRQESIQTAFLLSQGGEFAFVLLSLANELKVLPKELNRLLIIVVVLSMALTPFLAEAGKRFAESTVEEGDEGEASLPVLVATWLHHMYEGQGHILCERDRRRA